MGGDPAAPKNSESGAKDACVVEPGSDEELALRGEWMSRRMFAHLLPTPLAYLELRSYEAWLASRGLTLG